MIRERMEALFIQDRKQMRKIFEKFDRQHRGYLGVGDFQKAMLTYGVELSEREAAKVMNKFCEIRGQMTFNDWCLKFLGLPSDFFTMNLMHPEDPADGAGIAEMKSLRPVLPSSTTFKQVESLFRTRLRSRLFNVDGAVILCLKRSSIGDTKMNEDMFFNALMQNGIMCNRKQLSEIMSYFDQNRDGWIDYVELAHELLQLPRPGHVKHVMPFYPDRIKIGTKAKDAVQRLAINCERQAAPPARIFGFFKGFDKDGSGSISFDEVELMVREFGCEVTVSPSIPLTFPPFFCRCPFLPCLCVCCYNSRWKA